MYDPTIHVRSISRQIRKSDFKRYPSALPGGDASGAVADAVALASSGFGTPSITTSLLRGKSVHQHSALAEALLMRHVTANIGAVTRVRQSDRQTIIECIKNIVAEGLGFTVLKLDIKAFYESVNVWPTIDRLHADAGFSRQSVDSLKSFFVGLDAMGFSGLPRGLPISATMAEYVLRGFDNDIVDHPSVKYYSRFVDDIIIVTRSAEPTELLWDFVESCLPKGLSFNLAKSRPLVFSPFSKTSPAGTEHLFSFLGYSFDVSFVKRRSDNRLERAVKLDIAPSKVARLKTRIAKSLCEFNKSSDFDLLRDRIRLLTSNFRYHDEKSDRERISGLYFNYPIVDFSESTAFSDLDRFVRNILMSKSPKNRLRPHLTKDQSNEILGLSFSDGFAEKRFFSFKPLRLAEITGCWKYA